MVAFDGSECYLLVTALSVFISTPYLTSVAWNPLLSSAHNNLQCLKEGIKGLNSFFKTSEK